MATKEKKEERIMKDAYDALTWMYTATGGWRVDSPKKSIRYGYTAFKIFQYGSYLYHMMTIFLGVIRSASLQMLCFCLTYVLICDVGIAKILLLEFHIKKLKKLESRLDNNFFLPWVEGKQVKQLRKKTSDMLIYGMKLMFPLVSLGVVVTIFSPVLPNSNQAFVVPTPFDYLVGTSLFLPIYVYQTFSLISFIAGFTVYDMVFVGIVMRLCDQCQIIKLCLREIEAPMPDDGIGRESGFDSAHSVYDRKCAYHPGEHEKQQDWWLREKQARVIKNCIAHHQAVLREIKLIGQIYSFTAFSYACLGPVLMGLLAYVILSGTASINILMQQACYAVPAGIFLFMQCFFGTQLSIKCDEVRFAFYDCPWYNMDVRTRKLIVTALIIMEKTGKLRAGKFVDVALTTFLWSLKMSYNIVTFLKNTI